MRIVKVLVAAPVSAVVVVAMKLLDLSEASDDIQIEHMLHCHTLIMFSVGFLVLKIGVNMTTQ